MLCKKAGKNGESDEHETGRNRGAGKVSSSAIRSVHGCANEDPEDGKARDGNVKHVHSPHRLVVAIGSRPVEGAAGDEGPVGLAFRGA